MLHRITNWEQTGLVQAGFTTRSNGTSDLVEGALNLGLHVGDDPVKVRANREKVAHLLQVPLDGWVAGEQIHSDAVAVITESHRGRGSIDYSTSISGTDAMVTNVPGIILSTYAADCVPLLLFDPNQRTIGVAHAGWKGTALKVAAKTVSTMIREFGSRPEDIHVVLGPAIQECCYEVDAPVFVALNEVYEEPDPFFTEAQVDHWMLSLSKANQAALLEVGVRPEHIEILPFCTVCDNSLFFSHRAEKQNAGRHAGLIVLNKQD